MVVNTYQKVGVRLDIQSAEYVVQVPWTDLTRSAGSLYLGSEIYFFQFRHRQKITEVLGMPIIF